MSVSGVRGSRVHVVRPIVQSTFGCLSLNGHHTWLASWQTIARSRLLPGSCNHLSANAHQHGTLCALVVPSRYHTICSFAQTFSPSTRSSARSPRSTSVLLSQHQAEASHKSSGVYGHRKTHITYLDSTRTLLSRSHSRHWTSRLITSMASLSQPQTPAAPNSPMREHRHRPIERLTDRLETPSLDNREYRVVKLPNQLEVLLVHDAETDKASAAMDVNVGNFSDEEEYPGLAHAVEHLL